MTDDVSDRVGGIPRKARPPWPALDEQLEQVEGKDPEQCHRLDGIGGVAEDVLDVPVLFLALGADGFISGAGYNVEGQLGDREISATHRPVAVDFDALPGDQGNRLMAIRDQGDVVLDFSLATASAWTLYRDLTGPAVGTTPHATPLTAPGHRDAGAAADSADYYYALRGLSPCTLTEGP